MRAVCLVLWYTGAHVVWRYWQPTVKKMNLGCRTSCWQVSWQASAEAWTANNIILSPPPVSPCLSLTFPIWWHDGYDSVTLTARVGCKRTGINWGKQRETGRESQRYIERSGRWREPAEVGSRGEYISEWTTWIYWIIHSFWNVFEFFFFFFLPFSIHSACWVLALSEIPLPFQYPHYSVTASWPEPGFMFDVLWSLGDWNFLPWSEVAIGYLWSEHMSVGRITNISLGSPSFYALAETGEGIDLVGGLEFLLGANENNYKKIIKGLTFCCTHE